MSNFEAVKGLMIGLDGVLYVGNTPVSVAIQAVNAIRAQGVVLSRIPAHYPSLH